MAENLDPYEIEQFNRNMQELNEILPSVASGLAGVSGVQQEAKNNGTANNTAVKANTELLKARTQADKEAKEAAYNLKQALGSATQSLKGFGDALMKVGGGFEKYNSAISSAGDAAFTLGKNFGATGLALGGFIKGLTVVSQLYTKQADAMLKASDELSQIGAVGEITSKELLEMAHNAGYSSKNMEGFVKATKSLGTDMLMLGGTVNSGVQEFSKLATLSKQQVDAYRQMGITQEEYTQNTADSIKLMSKSGQVITERMKQDGSLRAAAKEYTDSLLTLSALTGESTEALKKNKEAALANVGVQVMLAERNKKQRDLEDAIAKETDAGRKEQLKKQLESQKNETENTRKLLENARMIMSPEKFAGFQKMVTTGAYTKESAMFANANPGMLKFIEDVKKGTIQPEMLSKKMADDTARLISEKGGALKYSEDAQRAFGTDLQSFENLSKMGGKTYAEREKEIEQSKARTALAAAGLGPEDKTKEARNATLNAERSAQLAFDDLVKAANPLVNGFNATTIAATSLAAAAVAASVALGQMAAGKMLGSAGDAAAAAKGKAAKGALTGKFAKGAGVGAVGAIGAMGLGMVAENQAAKGNTKTAAAADVGSSALTGASIGATVGSVVPVLGTAVGAAVGGALGAGYGLYQNWGAFDSGAEGGTRRGVNTDLPQAKGPIPTYQGGQMSEREIKDMIIRHEGKRNEPYKDSLGLWTVGVGHLIGDGKSLPAKWNRSFSDAEVMALFDMDYEHHRKAAEGIPGFNKISSVGQGALTDLTFNMGPGWISRFKQTGKALEEGNTELAARNLEQSKWYTQVGNRAPEIVGMLRNSKISASVEGIVSGPESGWNATGHGTEIMKRLQPDSILDRLANTPATAAASSGMSSEDMAAMMAEAFEKFSSTMEDMKSGIAELNSTQADILKYSKV